MKRLKNSLFAATCIIHLISISAISEHSIAEVLNNSCYSTIDGNRLSADKSFYGSLCSIVPSKTKKGTRDHKYTFHTPGPGFGYHVLGIPNNLNDNTPIWIHFSGGLGTPFDHKKKKIVSQQWLSEVVDQGYLILHLAYENSGAINETYCADSNVDWCASKVREEILLGPESQFDSSSVNVNVDNSVIGRIINTFKYLKGKGFPLPKNAQPDKFYSRSHLSKVIFSGHSQGAGLAFYIAKYTRIRGTCGFAGPYDKGDNVRPIYDKRGFLISDWIADNTQVTPLKNVGGFVIDTDQWVDYHKSSFRELTMEKDNHWFEFSGRQTLTSIDGIDVSHDGHGAIMGAVELREERSKCFEIVKR